MTPKPPCRIGKYSVLGKLGSGGFGSVWEAVDNETGEIVAIKILDKAELQLNDMADYVKKEINLLYTLKHPNIVTGYEVLNSKTKIYLVMEYVGGGDLQQYLEIKKRFPEKHAQSCFASLMSCLHYCHARGVHHRDLKLENLLLTSAGQLKVCDFGLANIRPLCSEASRLCRTIVGTEDFNAPEILQNLPYCGDEADMWSAGIILYVMITGFCPFRGKDTKDLYQNIIRGKLTFPLDFPPEPKKIVKMLLEPEGKNRPAASEVINFSWVNSASSEKISLEMDNLSEDAVLNPPKRDSIDARMDGTTSSARNNELEMSDVEFSGRATLSGNRVAPGISTKEQAAVLKTIIETSRKGSSLRERRFKRESSQQEDFEDNSRLTDGNGEQLVRYRGSRENLFRKRTGKKSTSNDVAPKMSLLANFSSSSPILSSLVRPTPTTPRSATQALSQGYVGQVVAQTRNRVYLALAISNIPDFCNTYALIRDENIGLPTGTQRWRLRAYTHCFTGLDAVTWFAEHLNMSRQNAVSLGQKFLRAGVLHHVCRHHNFKDEYLFYRWQDEEEETSAILNLQKAWCVPTVSPDPVATSQKLLKMLLSIYEKHGVSQAGWSTDMRNVQVDAEYADFMVAVGELQIVDIDTLENDNQKLPFLVNVYNLFWLQARIHLSTLGFAYHKDYELEARLFQYVIDGTPVSFADIANILFDVQEKGVASLNKERNRETDNELSSTNDYARVANNSLAMLHPTKYIWKFGKRHGFTKGVLKALALSRVEPLLHFVLCDATRQSPQVRPVDSKSLTKDSLQEVAREYLGRVVKVDVAECSVSYPRAVAKFRDQLGTSCDLGFLETVRSICRGEQLQKALLQLEWMSVSDGKPLSFVVKSEH